MTKTIIALLVIAACVALRYLTYTYIPQRKTAVRRVIKRMNGLYSREDLPPAKAGYEWVKKSFDWIEVCDTCGSNCGQCGNSFRDARRLPAEED